MEGYIVIGCKLEKIVYVASELRWFFRFLKISTIIAKPESDSVYKPPATISARDELFYLPLSHKYYYRYLIVSLHIRLPPVLSDQLLIQSSYSYSKFNNITVELIILVLSSWPSVFIFMVRELKNFLEPSPIINL